MKKLLIVLVSILCIGFVCADVGVDINIHPVGYMNHTIFTKWDNANTLVGSAPGYDVSIYGGSDPTSTESYNMYTLGLDVTYQYYYGAISFGIPFKAPAFSGYDPTQYATDPLWKACTDPNGSILGTVLMDIQLGGGATFLKKLPINIFVGGGIAINYLHAKQASQNSAWALFSFTDPNVHLTSLAQVRDITQMGLGVRASVNYKFMKNVGVSLTLSDSILPLLLSTKRQLVGKVNTGQKVTAKPNAATEQLVNQAMENEKKLIKMRFSNNFALRLGVQISF